ncbi:DUF1456 family protein [Arenibacter certesii]|nr:DUF1456 family protein [Arenibacter certesii]
MTNNDILKKLRVALKLRNDEIVDILALVDFKITKSELGAFFRKEDHPNYVECGDQILRNFLNGMVIHYRGTKENPIDPETSLPKPVTSAQPKAHKAATPPSYKDKQKRKIDQDISPVRYKNKKKS